MPITGWVGLGPNLKMQAGNIGLFVGLGNSVRKLHCVGLACPISYSECAPNPEGNLWSLWVTQWIVVRLCQLGDFHDGA